VITIGKKIKVLRSYNGGKYTSKDFDSFFKYVGIRRALTVPYNQNQNGYVERKNWSIIKTYKKMIHDMDFPMCLWAEACNIIV
jgi:transposase InsO family protein